MKPGSIVTVKGELQKMTVKSIERGVVVCDWFSAEAPTYTNPMPLAEHHQAQFFYHNLVEVK